MSKRKTRFGRPLSAEAAVVEILAGNYVYVSHKPMHPGWMLSMNIRTLKVLADRGLIRTAVCAVTGGPYRSGTHNEVIF